MTNLAAQSLSSPQNLTIEDQNKIAHSLSAKENKTPQDWKEAGLEYLAKMEAEKSDSDHRASFRENNKKEAGSSSSDSDDRRASFRWKKQGSFKKPYLNTNDNITKPNLNTNNNINGSDYPAECTVKSADYGDGKETIGSSKIPNLYDHLRSQSPTLDADLFDIFNQFEQRDSQRAATAASPAFAAQQQTPDTAFAAASLLGDLNPLMDMNTLRAGLAGIGTPEAKNHLANLVAANEMLVAQKAEELTARSLQHALEMGSLSSPTTMFPFGNADILAAAAQRLRDATSSMSTPTSSYLSSPLSTQTDRFSNSFFMDSYDNHLLNSLSRKMEESTKSPRTKGKATGTGAAASPVRGVGGGNKILARGCAQKFHINPKSILNEIVQRVWRRYPSEILKYKDRGSSKQWVCEVTLVPLGSTFTGDVRFSKKDAQASAASKVVTYMVDDPRWKSYLEGSIYEKYRVMVAHEGAEAAVTSPSSSHPKEDIKSVLNIVVMKLWRHHNGLKFLTSTPPPPFISTVTIAPLAKSFSSDPCRNKKLSEQDASRKALEFIRAHISIMGIGVGTPGVGSLQPNSLTNVVNPILGVHS